MRITPGPGGWTLVERNDEGVRGDLYVRLEKSHDERWVVRELYLDGQGEEITAEALRRIPLAAIVSFAVEDEVDDRNMTALAQEPGVPISLLAANFLRFPGDGDDWIADSLRSQEPGSPVRAPERPRRPPWPPGSDAPPKLSPPAGRGLTDAFLGQVAEAYRWAVRRRRPPAPLIHELVSQNYSIHTVRKWIRLARERGFLPPASRRGGW